MSATEHVVLVDENDNQIGIAEKLEAHKLGLCHRAFSVFIFRRFPRFELLLQQRADGKYHSGGLWTNTCCSHPLPGEDVVVGGERRLLEEMGISASLRSLGWFHYTAQFGNGLAENEVDHVLVGVVGDLEVVLNPLEAQAYRWVGVLDLKKEIEAEPERFTAWLGLALGVVVENLGAVEDKM